MRNKKIHMGKAAALCLCGLFSGFVNGFLGAGGGIIIVFALSKILCGMAEDKNAAFATALCVMLPLSGVSAVMYALRGSINLEGFGIFALPAIIGGAVGGFLLGKLNSDLVKRLFAALTVISGILLIVR